MTETEHPADLNEALAILQTRLPRIPKKNKAQGRSFAYSYADLADVSEKILPVLGSLGLAFVAMPDVNEHGLPVLRYELRHTAGEKLAGTWLLPRTDDPQATGSALTYARRYCLCAVTGAAPEEDDDDGRQAAALPPVRPDAISAEQITQVRTLLEQMGIGSPPEALSVTRQLLRLARLNRIGALSAEQGTVLVAKLTQAGGSAETLREMMTEPGGD
jgi:ERF superfamily protein